MIKIIPLLIAVAISSVKDEGITVPDKPPRSNSLDPIFSVSGGYIADSLSRHFSHDVSHNFGKTSSSDIVSSSENHSSSEISSSIISSSSKESSVSSIVSSSSIKSSSKEHSSSAVASSSKSSSSVISSSSQSSSSLEVSSEQDYFYCERYGPFSTDVSDKVEMTFKYCLANFSSDSLAERVRIFVNGQPKFGSKKAPFNYVAGTTKEVTFKVNIHDYLSNAGLELRFELLTTSSLIIHKSYAVTIYPPTKERLLATQLKYYPYESKCVAFYADGTGFHEIKDYLDFTKYGDYVDNDYYYRLDIGRNVFYYSNDYEIDFNSAYLRFLDDDLLFPNFTHEENGEIVLPLKLWKREEKVSFQFKDKFYVQKKTLDVSDTYQPGYIISSSFYLPINSHSKFNGKTIYIDINGLGLNQISTTLSLKYELNRLIVGSCSDGEYCVHGGVS